jgi:hypothetical protein
MKKFINLRNTLVVAAVALTAFTVTYLVSNSNMVSSGNDGRDSAAMLNTHGYWDGELRVGRYLHTSGDESKYVEVFDDGTIQVFGHCVFADTITRNRETNENHARLIFGEGNFDSVECLLDEDKFAEAEAAVQAAERVNASRTSAGVDTALARENIDGINLLRESLEWKSLRHSYNIVREVNFVSLAGSPFGLSVADNGLTLIVNEYNTFRFAG